MLNRLNDWAHRKIHRRQRPQRNQEDEDSESSSPMSLIPALPARRSQPLTPASSREDLLESMSIAIAKSGFFQRLPADLRRQILIEAFGGRTVHMDISFAKTPLVLCGPELSRAIDKTGHYGIWITANDRNSDPLPTLAEKKSRQTWEWWGCVCHRDPEWFARRKGQPVSEPWTDACREGVARCDNWSGDVPHKCLLGAMGWLCTCRQAYVEGIEILYTTNTIHMASVVMMLKLSNLLLHQRLAMITSVEMVWRLDAVPSTIPARRRSLAPLSGKDALHALLTTIPKTLPSLRRLHVSLMWSPVAESPDDDLASRAMAELIVPLDGMVRDFGSQLRDCSIGLYSSLWRAIRDAGLWAGVKYQRGEFPSAGDRYWRPLPPLEGEVPQTAAAPEGYWITDGYDDSPPYPFAHINPSFNAAGT